MICAPRLMMCSWPGAEFFVIDREMYMRRPDLFNCGRTLIGAPPARGQNTDLNYFGVVPPRVKAFFEDFQERAWRLGISAMVTHNEVAPAQHEFAPIYLVANAAADQNILSMEGKFANQLLIYILSRIGLSICTDWMRQF